MTAFVFKRYTKSSCYRLQADILTDGSSQHVIYAWGQSNTFSAHMPTNRGTFLVDFSSNSSTVTATTIPSGALSIRVTMPATPVSADSTTYCYSAFTMPMDTNYQVVAFAPIVTSSLVHHIILYACSEDITSGYTGASRSQCTFRPYKRAKCIQFWLITAKGSAPRYSGY